MQRQIVRNKDSMKSNFRNNIQWKARASQCISRYMDWAEGGSEPMKISLFISCIINGVGACLNQVNSKY